MPVSQLVWDLIANDKVSGPTGKAGNAFDKLGGAGEHLSATMGRIAGAATIAGSALAAGAGFAVTAGVKTLASLETTETGFETLLGSAKRATKFMEWMKSFAETTPFELSNLTDASRLLLGVGASAKQVKGILQDWGNTAGAVGMDAEHFQLSMQALAQSISSGRFQLADLNQLANDGIPIYKILSEATGKPVKKLRELATEGKLLVGDVLPKLQRQMRKDYGGAMARQSETLTGLWSTLEDTFNIGMADALKPFQKDIKNAMRGGIRAIEWAVKTLPDKVNALKETVKGIDWAAMMGKASGIKKKAEKFAQPVIDGFKTGIDTGNFGPLGESIGKRISDAVKTGSSKLGEAIKGIDWVDMGKSLGAVAIPMTIGVLNGLFDGLMDMKFWKKHWLDFLLAVVAVIPIGKVAGVGAKFLKPGLLKMILEGLDHAGSGIWKGILKFVRWAAKGFASGFKKAAPEIYEAIKWLVEKNLLKAMYAKDAVLTAVRKLMNFIAEAPGKLVGKVATALGKIGKKVVKGLLDGLQSQWDNIRNFFTKLTDMIPSWKGPESRDRKLLTPAGRKIIEGLIDGLSSKKSKLKAQLEKITDTIASALDTRRGKLADLKSKFADLKSGIADAWRTSITDKGATQSDMLANFRQQIASARAMRSTLRKLAKMGLRNDLLQQLAAGGPEALAQAESILASGKGGVSQLNAQQKELLSVSGGMGGDLASRQYGAAIKRETAAVKSLEHTYREVNRHLKKLIARLEDGKAVDEAALTRWLEKVLRRGHLIGAR